MRAARRIVAIAGAAALLVVATGGAAFAHEERDSQFPPGTGHTPTYRPYAASTPHLVVCKPDSASRIAAIKDAKVKALNQQLLPQCAFRHIQAAVDAVKKQGTNIYVLPGLYREEPSQAPPCTKGYDGGIVSYDLIVSCGEVINLVTIAGDDPKDPDIVCDNALCNLQIEGTGARMEDVVLQGGFKADGDWIKHNGIKADRADGFYLRNLTAELFRENAIYVHETDGYALDRINVRHNDLYGALTFTSDHGLIKDCEASYNGDSGIYPGGQADVNKDSRVTGPLTRWAVEVTGCESHHNALGHSGTAGNSVYFHGNDYHDNGAGYVTDSFVPNHPGMPQDHAWITGNRIHSNNSNYYKKYVQSGICAKKPADRGYLTGTVCPAFPVPVGTGILIAAGNYNYVNDNLIYDNWRAGAMLFWVPGAIREDYAPTAQYDTSNGNWFKNNRLGFHPSGVTQPNGIDFSWDEQGVGNCWEGNVSSTGKVTDDSEVIPLPTCAAGGSASPIGNVTKTARNAPCATYDRDDERDPPGCNWFDDPKMPAARRAAPGESASSASPSPAQARPAAAPAAPAASLPSTGATLLPAVVGLLLAGLVLAVHRRRSA
ncbi:MAG: right-handed parallel beta-helix repeat-containing protein [Actinobacteria bacterium]|nr:right-handed parallel beta-helix repeat-containing protein [Actinomycetota bacterium]MCA1721111.1 right-handed parallel beta-helix repeat-containing protein [Actinomycetota bacterium]